MVVEPNKTLNSPAARIERTAEMNMSAGNCGKSFSCESLYVERPSLKRKHNATGISGVGGLSINGDDICYLFNCGELIKIVKELGIENDKLIAAAAKDFDECDTNKATIFKDCVNGFNKEDSIVEFSKWLNLKEKQLHSCCYCRHMSNTESNASDWTNALLEHKAIQSDLESVGRKFVNAIKLNGSCISKSLLGSEERRWKLLWLKSLEYFMIIEQFKLCPRHNYRDVLSEQTPSSSSPPKRHKLNSKCFVDSASEYTAFMKNRRIQTTMVGANTTDKLDHLRGAQYELIHKDIGYSSDADMSDACENHQETCVVSPGFARKRHTRRRKAPPSRNRPWSIHSEWPDWDYYQPPPCITADYKGSEVWNSYDDENVVRSLIEFGENYEFWIKNEDDAIIRASTPKKELDEILDDESQTWSVDDRFEVPAKLSKACETDEKQILLKSNKRRTSTVYFVLLAVSLLIALVSFVFAVLPPHYQKKYPKFPPPV